MGTIEQGGKIATATIETLRGQPLAVALIVVNILFLIGGGYIAKDFSDHMENASIRQDALMSNMASKCFKAGE